MSSCCLIHPQRLLERYKFSIKTIKFIQKNCSIFENILLDEYEQLERFSSKYLMQSNSINYRLENLSQLFYELQCLTMKCSIWLKTYSRKQIHCQLKSFRKRFHSLEKFVDQHLIEYENKLTRKFWKDFSIFQKNYQQQTLQMDSIEYEHMKLFLESIRLFSSGNNTNKISAIDIEQNIKEWKDKNQFHITWLPNEHQVIEKSSSDIDIKPIDDYSSQDTYAYESNLSWSFIIPKTNEDLLVKSLES